MAIMSMMVLCNADAIIEYDGRRSGLSSAPLDMEYDNSSTASSSPKHRLSILLNHVLVARYFRPCSKLLHITPRVIRPSACLALPLTGGHVS